MNCKQGIAVVALFLHGRFGTADIAALLSVSEADCAGVIDAWLEAKHRALHKEEVADSGQVVVSLSDARALFGRGHGVDDDPPGPEVA